MTPRLPRPILLIFLSALLASCAAPPLRGTGDLGVVMATSGDCFNMGPEWVTYLERGSRGSKFRPTWRLRYCDKLLIGQSRISNCRPTAKI
mgnify:CR=1 FL=1